MEQILSCQVVAIEHSQAMNRLIFNQARLAYLFKREDKLFQIRYLARFSVFITGIHQANFTDSLQSKWRPIHDQSLALNLNASLHGVELIQKPYCSLENLFGFFLFRSSVRVFVELLIIRQNRVHIVFIVFLKKEFNHSLISFLHLQMSAQLSKSV